MLKIQTLNSISEQGLAQLSKDRFEVSAAQAAPDGILVRSADMHKTDFAPSLAAIARAGAGVNNIPIDRCNEAGIVVFNTPGANANAVKELVILGLLLASRKVAEGIAWAKTLKGKGDEVAALVEKGKGQFAGPELLGKKLGVVGLGAIGVMVCNTAIRMGMEVVGFDPYLSVKNAWGLDTRTHLAHSAKEVYEKCDYLSFHIPLTPETAGSIDRTVFDAAKPGVRIMNFARGELVNNADLIKALESGQVAAYVTDFPSDTLLDLPGVICIPHLGASTPESEENCAMMAVHQLADYLENGNIVNSVNMPGMEAPWGGERRVCVIHQNIPTMISSITALFSEQCINIEHMTNSSRGVMSYTMIDINGILPDSIPRDLATIEGVLRVRVL